VRPKPVPMTFSGMENAPIVHFSPTQLRQPRNKGVEGRQRLG